MKKKILIISTSIIIVLAFIVGVANKNSKVYTEINGVRYAILVNGSSATTFPSGNYKATVSCTNATGYWNQAEQKMIVKNITGNPTCDISFTSINSNDYLNTYISSLVGQTVGSGQVVSENGIRYEGKDPINYVMFNNELWRIIGVFDSSSHGQTGKNLVKIIRNEQIGGIAWEKNNNNDWPNSSLYALLNGAYYNHTVDTTDCYQFSTSVPATCDYTIIGIQNAYQGMIENVTWYLGGGGKSGYTTYTPDSHYQYERTADSVYNNSRPSSTTGKVGLVYLSDYGYAVLASNCSRSTYMTSYDSQSSCLSYNWLFGAGSEWTISPFTSGLTSVWFMPIYGRTNTSATNNGYGFRPVVYLSESTYIVSGTGTQTNPYVLWMATTN